MGLKKLSKALGVLVALIVVVAIPSMAQGAEFHSSAENTIFSGSQTGVNHFQTGTFDWTCESAQFVGYQEPKTASSLTITPTYKGCHVIIIFTFAMEFKTNGCDYRFHGNGDFEIVCPEGKTIEMTSAGCTMKIGPQKISGGAAYSNNAEKTRITVLWTVEAVHYTQSGSSCASLTSTNLTFTGQFSLSGTAGGVPKSVWWE